jgi:hypothetical protein
VTAPVDVTRSELMSERWLAGWKAIADAINCTPKSARRWAGRGSRYTPGPEGWLPVFDGPYIDGARVYAPRALVQEWQSRRMMLRRVKR